MIKIKRTYPIELPLKNPPEELNYELLKHFKNFSTKEIAIAIGWNEFRVEKNLVRLEKAKLIRRSFCFTKKLTWIKPPEREKYEEDKDEDMFKDIFKSEKVKIEESK